MSTGERSGVKLRGQVLGTIAETWWFAAAVTAERLLLWCGEITAWKNLRVAKFYWAAVRARIRSMNRLGL